jgi:molybdopterin/thiamine biosynthesis adenylyltransferase
MKKIVIVGVGALGSHVVQFLRNVKAEICVIDFDRVEMKNVSSQFHAKNTVGKKKTEGLARSMSFLYGTKLRAIPHRLTADNVTGLLGGADLVIDCLDNAASRRLVQNYCHDVGEPGTGKGAIPCLHGALDAAGSFGRVIWSDGFVIDEEGAQGAATCEDGEFLPFIAITAAYLARSAQLFLDTGKQVGFSISPTNVFST